MNKHVGTKEGSGKPGRGRPGPGRPRGVRRPGPAARRLYAGEAAGDQLSAQTLAVMRRLFETTRASQVGIARTLGISDSTVQHHAKLGGWRRPERVDRRARQRIGGQGMAAAGAPADGCGLVCPGLDACPVRESMHRRLYAGLERRLREAETSLDEADGPARERETRTLASLARTLDKLAAMDRATARAAIEAAVAAAALAPLPAPAGSQTPSEEEAPYDVEELRRELARRLDRLLEAGEAG